MSMANGLTMPMFSYIFGEMTDSFKPRVNITPEEANDKIIEDASK